MREMKIKKKKKNNVVVPTIFVKTTPIREKI